MPRPLRIQFAGAIYHVTIRGNGRADIFSDDHDRERFLERLEDSLETYAVRLYLFCLMNNHVHLTLETPQGNLSRFMQSLETGYTVYYNLRHDRPGHVMQGRYSARLVSGDRYLLNLSRYVHLNPVFVEQEAKRSLTDRKALLRNYRWSSYPGYAGIGKEYGFVTSGPILSLIHAKKNRDREAYRKYIEAGLADTDEEFLALLKESRLSIGNDDFREKIRELYRELAEKNEKPEDVAFRQQKEKVSAKEIIELLCETFGLEEGRFKERKRNSAFRPVAAKMLSKYGGLTNRKIAEILKIGTGAAIGCAVARLDAVLEKNRALKVLLPEIEKKLAERSKKNCDTLSIKLRFDPH